MSKQRKLHHKVYLRQCWYTSYRKHTFEQGERHRRGWRKSIQPKSRRQALYIIFKPGIVENLNLEEL